LQYFTAHLFLIFSSLAWAGGENGRHGLSADGGPTERVDPASKQSAFLQDVKTAITYLFTP
jgi:hypothetical protein